MKVNIEREVDIDRLLINLNEQSLCKDPGMAGYEVTVNKQLLRDAHDVIAQFVKRYENENLFQSMFGGDINQGKRYY